MFEAKISRKEVLNIIDFLMDYYSKDLEKALVDKEDKKQYESQGAIKALQKLKHELDMEMILSPYRRRQRDQQKQGE